MIESSTIERISEAAEIVEVVSDYVDLKRRGVNMLGLCPFHNEKTPSFIVSPSKGIYKCFGCGEGGDSITFIMKQERVGFIDAVRLLAKKCGIEIEEQEESEEAKSRRKERESQQLIVNRAVEMYQSNLLESSVGESRVLPFLQDMGLRKDIIEKFNVGFAGGELSLYHAMKRRGFKSDLMVKSGLIVKDKTSEYRDVLLRRVVMPIYSVSGRVTSIYGQTAGVIKGVPLHMVTEDSTLFDIDKELFGLYQGKGDVVKRDNCFVVDTPLDVMLMHLSGMEGTVTPLTAAVTERQILMLKRFTSTVTIIFSGVDSMLPRLYNSVRALLKEECSVKIISLPGNEPISNILQNRSAHELVELFDESRDDWFVALYKLVVERGSIQDREDNIKRVLSLISMIPNPIFKGVYIGEASRILNISEDAIKRFVG